MTWSARGSGGVEICLIGWIWGRQTGYISFFLVILELEPRALGIYSATGLCMSLAQPVSLLKVQYDFNVLPEILYFRIWLLSSFLFILTMEL